MFLQRTILICIVVAFALNTNAQSDTLNGNVFSKKEIRKYDKRIIKIIKQNSNTKKGKPGVVIKEKINALPYVEDVLWDGCYDKILIYPTTYHLMVNMKINGTTLERDYLIREAKIRTINLHIGKWVWFKRTYIINKNKLDFIKVECCIGCIKKAREYCLEKKFLKKLT